MYEIELDKARTALGELIQTALGGEEVVIMENGKPILKLVRVSSTGGRLVFSERTSNRSSRTVRAEARKG
ncbi:MAG: hypothetical protein QOD00_468 [Blastocatellia bacterium]|jgi:antitoxin (DNA-binding transcriptional repressor) of toxin-antitoxin stability system|nr:hypothetical protein [Blastocatellia bacterium]